MIVEAEWSDILSVALDIRGDDFDEIMATRWNNDLIKLAEDTNAMPWKLVAKHNGKAVAVGGVSIIHPQVGQAWLYGTDDIGKCGYEIATYCKEAIAGVFDSGELSRIQAFSKASHKQAHRWLKAIGLHEESRMQKYGKRGEEFIIFAVTK